MKKKVSRRKFVKTTAAATAAVAVSTLTSTAIADASGKFKLKYAPSFGMFRQHAGNDPIDQLKFMADQGFSAMFDNGLMGKQVDIKNKIANINVRNEDFFR